MKNRPFQLQFLPQLKGIYQITVMRQCQPALDMVNYNRLCVQPVPCSCRTIAGMAQRHIPLAKLRHNLRRKYIVYQTVILMVMEQPIIIDYNAAAFLPSVLQSEQAVISCCRHSSFAFPINAEYTAFFMKFVHFRTSLHDFSTYFYNLLYFLFPELRAV